MAYSDRNSYIDWQKSMVREDLAHAIKDGTLSRLSLGHSRLFWLVGSEVPPTPESLQTNLTWDQALKLYIQQTMHHEYVLEVPYVPAWWEGIQRIGSHMRNWTLALSCGTQAEVEWNLDLVKGANGLPHRVVLVITPGDTLHHDLRGLTGVISGVVFQHPEGMRRREFSDRADRFVAELAIAGVPYWISMLGPGHNVFDGGFYRIFDSEASK